MPATSIAAPYAGQLGRPADNAPTAANGVSAESHGSDSELAGREPIAVRGKSVPLLKSRLKLYEQCGAPFKRPCANFCLNPAHSANFDLPQQARN